MPTLTKEFAKFKRFQASRQRMLRCDAEKLLGHELPGGDGMILVYDERWYIEEGVDCETYYLILGSNDWVKSESGLEELEWRLFEYAEEEGGA